MELWQQFAQGDQQAFETLFRQFQSEVYGWIIRIVRDPGIAEDLTLESFWRIYRARARYDPARSFSAWARRIATNAALDHLKARRRLREEQLSETLAPKAVCGVRDANPGVEADLRAKVALAFRHLPPKYQVVATLALIEEKSQSEIAEALGISSGAVKSREFRALRMLRKKLRGLGIEP